MTCTPIACAPSPSARWPSEYDRLRPTIPPALVDDLVALAPARVLDVGCGTGKVARALLERGLSVLGVEFDERMAAIARGHGVEVEVGAFEDWDARGRTFDLIVASDSLALDRPRARLAQGRRGARAGRDDRAGSGTSSGSSRRCARPSTRSTRGSPPGSRPSRPVTWTGTIRAPRTGPTAGRRRYSADDYVALAGTYSISLSLDPDRRAELAAELHAAIMAAGGVLRGEYQTLVSRSRARPR